MPRKLENLKRYRKITLNSREIPKSSEKIQDDTSKKNNGKIRTGPEKILKYSFRITLNSRKITKSSEKNPRLYPKKNALHTCNSTHYPASYIQNRPTIDTIAEAPKANAKGSTFSYFEIPVFIFTLSLFLSFLLRLTIGDRITAANEQKQGYFFITLPQWLAMK